MVWISKTKQFSEEEMAIIANTPAQELVEQIVGSEPVVVLRVLAEIMLNGDEEKLDALLMNAEVNARWQDYYYDFRLTTADVEYADKLKARLVNLEQNNLG